MNKKIALIFGGSRGIGQSIAKLFYCNGYETVVASRNISRINESIKGLPSNGNLFTGLPCNVTEEITIQNVFKSVEELFASPPDVVVNSAGINVDGLLAKYSQQQMEAVLHTNIIGSLLISKHAIRHMLSSKKNGCIICIGSIVGCKGHRGQSVYSTSKASLVGLTKSLAREVASRGIRVNMVEPGFIQTDMTASSPVIDPISIPMKRFGQPNEVAEVVYFLSTTPYITGQVLPVDGGLQLCF